MVKPFILCRMLEKLLRQRLLLCMTMATLTLMRWCLMMALRSSARKTTKALRPWGCAHSRKLQRTDCQLCKHHLQSTESWNCPCGAEFRTRRLHVAHKHTCNAYQEQKRKNILKRMKKTNRLETVIQNRITTARKTSARPDIQRERAERLAAWREREPEKFIETLKKARSNTIMNGNTRKSKGEIWLSKIVGPFGFKPGYCVMNGWKKQIDYVRKAPKFYLEVDGPHHFRIMYYGQGSYLATMKRDRLLKKKCLKSNIPLLRISYEDCFRNQKMKTEWLTTMIWALKNQRSGI